MTRYRSERIMPRRLYNIGLFIFEFSEFALDNQFFMVASLDASDDLRVDVERLRDGDDFFRFRSVP